MTQTSLNSSAQTPRARRGWQIALFSAVAVAALAASAVTGAWLQARYGQQTLLSPENEVAIVQQLQRDSEFVRGSVDAMAQKLGSLQAKLIEIDGISKRLAEVAGVSYTDPEIQASLDASAQSVMDYLDTLAEPKTLGFRRAQPSDLIAQPGSDLGLVQYLDILEAQLEDQKDRYSMLDLVLTKRAGVEAGLPSLMPVNYPYLSSSYGWRRHPITGRYVLHEGLDFSAPRGTPIYASSGGLVTFAAYKRGYGNMVEISHGNDLVTRYAHADQLLVKPGDFVEKGQEIAKVGSTGNSTGPHLHFEVRIGDHPLDPTLFLAQPEEPADTLVANATKASDTK